MAKVAFIGLGVMGYPMAGHLTKCGHEVTVYNRTTAKAVAWVDEFGGSHKETPFAAAKGQDFVLSCVGNDDDLRAVILSENGALAAMSSGAILVDHTTTSAKVAKEVAAACKTRGVGFIDAPISGGQSGAQKGILTVMVGGEQKVFDAAEPIISAYSHSVVRLGDSGSGQLAKMVNQICCIGVLQGLAEGLHFAKSAGLDAEKVIEVISKGAAQSWMMDNRHQTMLKAQYDFGFTVDWMRKDLGIVLDEAKQNGSDLPLTALIDQFYGEIQQIDGNNWDISSLLVRLERERQ